MSGGRGVVWWMDGGMWMGVGGWEIVGEGCWQKRARSEHLATPTSRAK